MEKTKEKILVVALFASSRTYENEKLRDLKEFLDFQTPKLSLQEACEAFKFYKISKKYVDNLWETLFFERKFDSSVKEPAFPSEEIQTIKKYLNKKLTLCKVNSENYNKTLKGIQDVEEFPKSKIYFGDGHISHYYWDLNKYQEDLERYNRYSEERKFIECHNQQMSLTIKEFIWSIN